MSSQQFYHLCSVRVIAALALAFVLASSPAAADAPDTREPAELLLNTTVRHAAIAPEPGAVAAARFRMEIPEAGILALDLTVAGGMQPEPVLHILGNAPRRIAQTPTSLLVEIREAGTLFVEVAALEHDQRLPAFKLRSAFEATSPAADSAIDKDVDPWDDDLDGKTPPPPPPPPNGAVAGDLCALGEQDDHGDVSLCATPIVSAKTVAGVLHNDAGDDEDLFVFHLPVMAVVTVEATSDSALRVVLRDRDGLAVAVTQSADGGTPMRLARALGAGRYFLEVEGLNGDDAVYALTLHRPSRP
jgi:hypothetical protein